MRTGTPTFIGCRLTEARQARQLTMTDLAEFVGISPQAISAFEKGCKTPHPRTLQKIAKHLKMPVEFFSLPLRIRDEAAPAFARSLSAATKRARWGAQVKLRWLKEIHHYLQGFVRFPTLDLPNPSLPRDPISLSYQEIEDLANKCRRHWSLGDGPISDIILLLENKGFVIGRSMLGTPKLDAMSKSGNGNFYAILGRDKASAVRSRFDASHETGHAILHAGLSQRSIQRPEDFKVIETQAHRFAAALLFPRVSFLEEVLAPSLDLFASLKPRWKLSIKMMILRARHLDLVSERQYRNMLVGYNRRGWHHAEPYDDTIPSEKPRLLRRAIELLSSKGRFPVAEIKQSIGLGDAVLADLLDIEPSQVIAFPTLEVKRSQYHGEKTQLLRFPSKKAGEKDHFP